MRTFDSIWNRCLSGDIPESHWDYVKKLTINGTVYSEEDMFSLTFGRGVMDKTFSLGNTISADMKAVVVPPVNHSISIGDLVKLEIKITTKNDGDSPYYEFGYFYLTDAKKDGERWTLTAYDKLHTLNTPFTAGASMSATSAISAIVNFMGVQLDSRTSITNNKTLDKLDSFSMREVLGYIGSLNEGNWCMTENNKLRLIKPEVKSTEASEVAKFNSKNIIEKPPVNVTKVLVKTSSNAKDVFVAGSGNVEFEVFNPYGDQTLANSILARMQNYTMRPHVINSTEIHPGLELGDTIKIDGQLAEFVQVDWSSDMYASIATPSDVDRFQQTFQLEGGGGGTDERVDMLIDLLNLDKCRLIQSDEVVNNTFTATYENVGNGDTCVIIPRDYTNIKIRDERYASGILTVKSGGSLTTGQEMFSEVDWLNLEGFDSRNISNMNNMFEYVGDIINLSSLKTDKATSMKEMFLSMSANHTSLPYESTADLTSWKTMNVSTMEGMFQRSRFKHIDMSGLNLNNVQNMNNMFANTTSLKTLNLKNISFGQPKRMRRTFAYCGAPVLDISSFNLKDALTLEDMIVGAKFSEIILPTYSSKVSSKGLRFQYCDMMTDESLSKILNTFSFNDASDISFTNCESLINPDLSSLSVENLDVKHSLFDGCWEMKNFTKPHGVYIDQSVGDELNGKRYHYIESIMKDTPSFEGQVDLTFIERPMYMEPNGLEAVQADTFVSFNQCFVNCGADSIRLHNSLQGHNDAHLPENNPNGIPVLYA